jgi:ribose transport system permease protein
LQSGSDGRSTDGTPGARGKAHALLARLRRQLVWVTLVGLAAILALTLESFWTTPNLLNILNQTAIIALLATGMTLVLVAGHFDLSVGATLTLAAVLAIAMQPVDAAGTAAALLVPLAAGLAIGALNGGLVGGLGANSIVVTVAMQLVLAGLTLVLVSGQHVRVDNASAAFVAIGGRILGIPVPVLIMLAMAIVAHVVLSRTLFGRHVQAIGGSPAAAALVGIPLARRVLATFVISGALAALAGIVVAARVRNLDPTAGAGIELAALTAAVLGGTRLTGGAGNVLSTLAGALILGMVANAMRLLDLSYSLQLLLQGLVLVAAVALDERLRAKDR